MNENDNFLYHLLRMLERGQYQQAADEIHTRLMYLGFFTTDVTTQCQTEDKDGRPV